MKRYRIYTQYKAIIKKSRGTYINKDRTHKTSINASGYDKLDDAVSVVRQIQDSPIPWDLQYLIIDFTTGKIVCLL